MNVNTDPITLGICFTNKCNAKCMMCSLSCSPEKEQFLNKDKVKKCILQASQISTIKNIAFTGGEVFLYYDILLEYMLYAKSLGITSTLKSNGFWAKKFNVAHKKLEELSRAGLISIEISSDEFHQEFVPFEYALNALRAANYLGISNRLCIIKTDNWYKFINSAKSDIYGIDLKIFPLVNSGRCKKNENIEIEKFSSFHLSCPIVAQQITLTYNGDFFNCCGQRTITNSMLKLGNIENDTLSDIIKRRNENPFLFILKRKSFDWFIYWAQKFDIIFPKQVDSECELCEFFLSDDNFIKKLRPIAEEEVKNIKIRNYII